MFTNYIRKKVISKFYILSCSLYHRGVDSISRDERDSP